MKIKTLSDYFTNKIKKLIENQCLLRFELDYFHVFSIVTNI